jgi:HSP20 family molecular chaperone IbpA
MNKELVTEIINNWVNARAASADYQPESRCSFFDEDDKSFVAEFPLPGVEVDQISVKTAANKLIIDAQTSEEQEKRGIGGLSLVFALPNSADHNNIKADLHLGILKLTIPKKSDGGYKKVQIKTS